MTLVTALASKEYRIFQQAVTKWITKLQLESWSILTRLQGVNGLADPQALSEVDYTYQTQNAVITLANNWQNETFTREKADMTALHECLHLIFTPLMELFDDSNPDLVRVAEQEEHKIIATLEKVIFHKTRDRVK